VSLTSISSREVHGLQAAGQPLDLIDVRTPVEYREVHVEFARNVPLDRLNPAEVVLGRNGAADLPLYVICRAGGRGKQACEKFIAAGFPQVVRGKKVISLERQVRIAAGLLILLGILLGWLVHPAFCALSAFVGAGLVYAGLTDRCGMALLLARMPWNRGEDLATAY